MRYHQRTGCCALSLSLALNSNQRYVKEKEIPSCSSLYFLPEPKEKEKEILGISVLRHQDGEVCVWVWVDEGTNEQIKK